jgi:beta-galactosidase/beta-glucuronidase
VSPEAKPQSRKELADETVWRRELFFNAKVPETIENLFPMPDIWKFRLDYRDEGLLKGWEKSDYDDKGWQPASTGDYMERQGNFAAGGRFWYRVKFQAPEFPAGKKIVMRIGALDDDGDIYINGQLAFSRKFEGPDDWKSSFAFDITPYLIPEKENVIAVRGYDSFGAGGIWKPVAIYTEQSEL